MNFIGPYSDCLPYERCEWSGNGGYQAKLTRKISVTPGFPVAMDEIATDLRVEDDELDTITRMARAAATFLERRSGFAILQGRYESTFSSWSCSFAPWEFMRAPLRALVEVAVLDGSSSPPTWHPESNDSFFISPREKSFLLTTLNGYTPPSVWAPFDGIRVRFDAGYDALAQSGVDQESDSDGEPLPIPDDVRTILTMFTGEIYKNREAFAADAAGVVASIGNSMLTSIRQFW
jgi:uncharacterized phiE125 gp8 family phage protein